MYSSEVLLAFQMLVKFKVKIKVNSSISGI